MCIRDGNNTESIRLKGELAQAKAEIRLLKGQVEAHQALPASSAQTSLAVANRSIEHLNSENRRLSKECMEAIELARQWEDYSRRLSRQIGGQSTLQEQTEGGKPGFLKSALTAIGMIAVSYTHLDVYKRQTQGRRRHPAGRVASVSTPPSFFAQTNQPPPRTKSTVRNRS